MSQFRIKGIDYTDDSLQHGLGKGSGRGRPVGSKNGQVMPGAAYMKDYKIIGQKAEGENLQGPVNRNLRTAAGFIKSDARRSGASNQLRSIGEKSGSTYTRNGKTQRAPAQKKASAAKPAAAATTQASAPAASVAKGRGAVSQLMNGGRNGNVWASESSPVTTSQQMSAANMQPRPTMGSDRMGGSYTQNGVTARRSVQKPPQTAANATAQPEANTQTEATASRKDVRDFVRENQTMASASPLMMNGSQGNDQREQTIQEQTIPEQTIQEQTIPENTLTEQAPANTQQQETPAQKSLWDSIGGWLSQAGKDIGDTFVGAWDATKGAAASAADWVGDRLNEVGDWASTAYNDVSQWVGARGDEFGDWLNNAAGDAGRWVNNAANDAGRWLGNAANDTGRWLNNAAGDAGRWVNNAVNDTGRWLGNTANDVGQWVGNAVNDTGRWLNNAAGDAGRWVNNAANDAGQWVTNAAGDVGRWVNNAANDTGRWLGNTANDAGQWVTNAAGDVGRWVGNAANDAGNWVNNAVNDTGRWLNNAGQWIGDRAADVWEGPVTYNPRASSRIVTNSDGSQTRVYFGDYERSGGLRDQLGNAGQWLNENVVEPVNNTANDAWNNVRRAGSNAMDDVFGRYPVVDTDENGNLVYGNQRQGGLVGRLSRDGRNLMNQASQWANDNFVTPVDNALASYAQAADNMLNGTPVTNRYYDTQTGQWVEPGTRVGGVLPWVRNAYNTAEGAVVNAADAARDTAVNAYNSARDSVVDNYNRYRLSEDDYNDYRDDQNIRNLARQSTSYQNAPAESRQQVEQDFTDRYKTARNTQAYQAAVSAGVPTAELNNLIGNYAQGSMDSYDFVNELNRLRNLYANVYNQ